MPADHAQDAQDGQDGRPPAAAGRAELPGTGRVEAFSDGVFAIAITLLVLEVRPPADTHDLTRKLLDLWPSYLAYAVSFLLIGTVWANHHVMFERIAVSDRTLQVLNLLLLGNVAFLPFPTAVLAGALAHREGLQPAAVLYGGTLTVGGVLFNGVWQYAAYRHRLLDPAVRTGEVARIGRWFRLGPVLYGLATLVALASPIASVVLFVLLIAGYIVDSTRLVDRLRPRRLPRPG